MKNKISKQVTRIFYCFLAFYYLVPFLADLVYPDFFSTMFQVTGKYVYIIILPLFVMLILLFDNILPRINNRNKLILAVGKFATNNYVCLLLSVIYLILSFKFFSEYSIQFRHTESISGASQYVIFVFLLMSYFKIYIIYNVFRVLDGYSYNKYDWYTIIFVIVSFFLTANSTYDVLYLLILILVSTSFYKTIYFKSNSFSEAVKSYILYVFLMLFILLGAFMGIANKYGIDASILKVFGGEMAVLILRRLSMWYVSIFSSINELMHDYYFALDAWEGMFMDMYRRFKILIGMDGGSKPEIWSINRLNHTLVYKPVTSHAGSSPGLIATIFYIPFFPSGLFIMVIYTIYILRLLSKIISNFNKELSFIGYMLLMLNLLIFFESPISQLNIISKNFVYFLLAISMLNYYSQKVKKKL